MAGTGGWVLQAADGYWRREIISVRGQSYVSRLPKYDPPPPSPPGESVPPAFVGGGGGGGNNNREKFLLKKLRY